MHTYSHSGILGFIHVTGMTDVNMHVSGNRMRDPCSQEDQQPSDKIRNAPLQVFWPAKLW